VVAGRQLLYSGLRYIEVFEVRGLGDSCHMWSLSPKVVGIVAKLWQSKEPQVASLLVKAANCD
jgi:hypothetical protein